MPWTQNAWSIVRLHSPNNKNAGRGYIQKSVVQEFGCIDFVVRGELQAAGIQFKVDAWVILKNLLGYF